MSFSYPYRAAQLLWISLKHLLGFGLDWLQGKGAQSGPDHLKRAFEEYSGSFIKFGQVLSLQLDMLPREYCDALLNLLDRVPAFPRSGVNDVFHEEFQDMPLAIFEDFNYEPIGAASIGQVHKATYKGDIVAIKVQRPGIRKVFERDALLLNLLVRIVFLFRIRSLYFMRDPVREFHEWIEEELDYYREARHAELLGRNAAKMSKEKVPKVYWEVTTRRVLTTEYLDGCTVTQYLRMKAENNEQELAKIDRLNFNPTQFVTNIITNFISDALYYGMFHADLHPANLMILKNNVVGYVDFGIVGTFSLEARGKAIQLLLSHVSGDPDEILSSFLSISQLTDRADVEGFRHHLKEHAQDWYRQPPVGELPSEGV